MYARRHVDTGARAFGVVVLVATTVAASICVFGQAARGQVSGGSTGGSGARLDCAACLLVTDTGTELFARAAGIPRPNASTTKMVTALVVRRAARLDESVTVSARAAAISGGGLDLQAGDRLSVGGLLRALLLTSSNDAAVALAEHVSGSEERFVARMNALASSLGARASHFVTSHGLDAAGHFASARDLADIAEVLLEDAVLAEIVRSASARVARGGATERLENTNPLLESYPGAIGVKTGYTAAAGDVLVAAAKRHGRRLIAVAMGSEDAPADARRLLDMGFGRLARTRLVAAREAVGELVLDPAGSVPVVAARSVRGFAATRSTVRLVARRDLPEPLEAGAIAGTIRVREAGALVARVPVRATRAAGGESASWLERLLAGVVRTAHAATAGWA